MKRQSILVSVFALLLVTFQAAHAQSSFVLSGPQPGTAIPVQTITVTGQSTTTCIGCSQISLNQFAAVTDVNNDIAGLNSSVNSSVTNINASIAGVGASVAASIAGINMTMQNLKKEAWTGTALAASLTPTLPTDGNQNHINFSAATAGGVQAVSANYSHVDGPYDFIAGAAVSRTYSLAKIGVGFSW